MKNFILNSFKDKRFIWLLIGWISAFFVAGVVFLFFHTRLFINHFDAWIQTIGTLLGSFTGAALAGWFALRTINYQINAKKSEDEKKEHELYLKCLAVYASAVNLNAITNDKYGKHIINAVENENYIFTEESGIIELVRFFNDQIRVQLENLKSVRIIDLNIDDYFLLQEIFDSIRAIYFWSNIILELVSKDVINAGAIQEGLKSILEIFQKMPSYLSHINNEFEKLK